MLMCDGGVCGRVCGLPTAIHLKCPGETVSDARYHRTCVRCTRVVRFAHAAPHGVAK